MGWQDAPVVGAEENIKAAGNKWEQAPVVGEEAPNENGGFLSAIHENVVGSGKVDTPGERLGEMIRGGGAAVARGLADIPAIPGNLYQLAAGAGEYLGGKTREAFGEEPSEHTPLLSRAVQYVPGSQDTRAVLSAVTGGESDYVAPGTAGEYISTAGEFAGGAAVGGPQAMLRYGVTSGLGSEFAGQMAEGKQIPEGVPVIGGADAEPFARAVGAIAAPVGANALERLGRRAITPNPADPARTAMADRLNKEGVQTTAGQKTGNAPLKYREENVPRTQQILADQDEQFTRAALKRIGVTADRAEPEVMQAAYDRIGRDFNELAKRNSIKPDADLLMESASVVDRYTRTTAKSKISPIIKSVRDKIGRALMSDEPISGKQYQSWRSDLGDLTQHKDVQLKRAAHDLRNSLDDAMGRSLEAAGRAEDIAIYETARQQWRDYLAIERAVASAGSETAMGIINPRQLRTAISSQGKSQYARGQRDLGQLARAGNAVMSPLPNSGTAQRLGTNAIRSLDGGAGIGVGGLTYAITRDPQLSALAGSAASLTPVARNALSGTKGGQAYLSNQLLGQGGDILDRRMINALVGMAAEANAN